MTMLDNPVRAILSIEDSPDSTAAVVGSFRDEGLMVVQAETVQEATSLTATHEFSLILLDAKIPDRTEFDVDAGIRFIQNLKTSADGTPNRDTDFLVLTSFTHEIDANVVCDLPGFIGILSKTAVTTDLLREMTGLPLTLYSTEGPEEFLVEDLLVSEHGINSDDTVSFIVPAWPGEEPISLPIDSLPDDIATDLGWGDVPFFMWARVNIAAETASEVGPRDFRMYVGDDAELATFDDEAAV